MIWVGVIAWLAVGYVFGSFYAGSWRRGFKEKLQWWQRLVFLAFGPLGIGGAVVGMGRLGFGFDPIWFERAERPYGFPDTWLRGMGRNIALSLVLIVPVTLSAEQRQWLAAAVFLAGLVGCLAMDYVAWRNRGQAIRDAKALATAIVNSANKMAPPPQAHYTTMAGVGVVGAGVPMGPSSVSMGVRQQRHPDYPDTFGWRAWRWDPVAKLLFSPSQGTAWHGPEFRVEAWDERAVVRGVAGIHAELVPPNWETATSMWAGDLRIQMPPPPKDEYSPRSFGACDVSGTVNKQYFWDGAGWLDVSTRVRYQPGQIIVVGREIVVHGIVERFGKYALGTEGWRAEWVIIRKLLAPSTEIGLALEQAYPDVEVIYPKEEADAHR